MGEAYLDGGSEISQYRDLIENFSDSIDTYEDYFDQVWGKVSRFSDKESQRRSIRLGIQGRI
jgi:protein involved in sex pheromone biosynthesis